LAAGAALDPAETTVVQWLDASGKVIGGVRLGQTRQAPAREDQPSYGEPAGGRFVSREGDDKVYLVGDALTEFDADPKSWVDKQLLSVAATEVETVRLEHADGEKVELAKNGGDLTLQGLADNEEFDAAKRYGVGGALSYLRFSDVADPALGDDVTGMATASVYRATTTKGQTFEARIGASPEGSTDRYARFSVTLAPAVPEEVSEEADEAAAKAARETRASELAALEQSTDALNAKLSGWTYLIGSYNADNMTLRRAALVKEKAAVENPAEDAEAAQGVPVADAAAAPGVAEVEEPVAAQAPAEVEVPAVGADVPAAE